MIEVELSTEDEKRSRALAENRTRTSKGKKYRAGPKDDTSELHRIQELNGAGAECAVARAFDVEWHESYDVDGKLPDVGEKIQVRHSNKPRLLVRPDDRDDQYFVYVRGHMPYYEVVGYVKGADAKRDEWLADPGGWNRPCYLVPVEELIPAERVTASKRKRQAPPPIEPGSTYARMQGAEIHPQAPTVSVEDPDDETRDVEPYDPGRDLPKDKTDPADYERCRALAPYIDVPGGVSVNGRSGTLINAQITVPGFPAGCRILFDDETELVHEQKAKRPRTRDFRSEEVEIRGT